MKTEIIRRKRVLVVEDDAVFRDWVKLELEKQGYAVAHSNNGAEAMCLITNHEFDLILADLRLPFVTGEELAKRIKKLAPQQPVIIVTGNSTFRCLDNSADAVLFKPFESAELGKLIDQLLLKREQTSCN